MDFTEVVRKRRMVRSFTDEPLMLMLLAAVDEKVAAAFVGCDAAELRELLDIPADYLPVGIVLLGHEGPDARQYGDVMATPRKRRPRTDVVHYGHWSRRSATSAWSGHAPAG